MKKITLCLAALSFGFTTLTHSQSKTPIQLVPGQKYLVESKMTLANTTEAMGQSIEVKMDATSTYNIQVKGKAANYNLSNTFTSMKMNMDAMGRDMHFDSNNPDDMKGEIGQGLGDYINKSQDIEMTETGTVVTKKKDSAESPGASPLTQQIRELDATGFGATMAFQSLPSGLKEGTTWTDSTNADGISRNITYTVKKITGDLASVSFEGIIKTDVTMEQQGMEISTKSSGKISGDETVNIKTGVIQTNNSTTEQSGTISAMGQEMPVTNKVTVNTTTALQ